MIFTLLAVGVISGAVAAYISDRKGRSHIEGFLLGFMFGLIGVLIALMLARKDND